MFCRNVSLLSYFKGLLQFLALIEILSCKYNRRELFVLNWVLEKEVSLYQELISFQFFQSFSGPDGEFIMNPIPGEKMSPFKKIHCCFYSCTKTLHFFLNFFRPSWCWFSSISTNPRHRFRLRDPRISRNLWRYRCRLSGK